MARMATCYQDDERYIDFTAGSSIAAGDVVLIGTLVGVAVNDIGSGATGVVDTKGIYVVPAVNTAAFSVGDVLYWDNVAKKATKTSTGNTRMGVCVIAKAEAGTTCYVLLNR